MQIDRSKPILVTGASGYIASWIVKYLLDDGLQVHATVRDPNDSRKVAHLQQLAENSPGSLKLFAADLLTAGAFDEAMQGCELVMHTASPFVISGIKDPQAELVDPAVRGTTHVLEAANRVESVKRVVLTASVVSIYGDAVDMQGIEGDAFTEAHWNTTSSVDHQPYNYSKVAAERAAWTIADAQQRWDLVVINPGLVLGPSLTRASDSASLSTMRQFSNGDLKFGAPALEFGVVDVRDVAAAHIKAGLTPQAKGRHICVSASSSLLEMGGILREAFGPRYPFPKGLLPKALVWLIAPFAGLSRGFVKNNVGYPLKFDNSYTRQDLGMEFRPVAETVTAHFQQMIDDGIIRDKRPA